MQEKIQTTKNSDVRSANRKRVSNLLFRQGQMTKQELALKLNMSLPTVSTILKELSDAGLVTTGKTLDSTGGRKAVCHQPVYEAKYSVGAEASLHGIRLILLDLGVHVAAEEYFPLEQENTRAYWEKVDSMIERFCQTHVDQKEKILDMGITLEIPMRDGQVIAKKGQTADEIMNLDLARSCLHMNVKFRNSTKMAAVAQIWALGSNNNFVFVSLGNHVRGALIHQGNVMDFANTNGEFADIVTHGGSPGRLDDILSAENLCRKAQVPDLDTFFQWVQEGRAAHVWEAYLNELSIFLHALRCIFGWDIVLGGSLSPYLEKYRDLLEARMEAYNTFAEQSQSRLLFSRLGGRGAAVGAALLPIDAFMEQGFNL